MNEPRKTCDGIQTEYGLIGFFDILGYRHIAETNQIKNAAQVAEKILRKAEDSQEASDFVGKLIDRKFCRHVVLSDSIVVFSGLHNHTDQDTTRKMFASYCAGLVSSLLWEGLPVRGALSLGDYYVKIQRGSICLAGKPIVEAYQLSNCLDLACCVVAPSAEAAFPAETPDFIEYPVPIRGHGRQKMIALNNFTNGWAVRKFSRRVAMKKFAEHNKPVRVETISKINNTLEFYDKCRSHVEEFAKRQKSSSLPQ